MAEIVEMVKVGVGAEGLDTEAVRYYSATYLTEWDGKEGELVGRYLLGEISSIGMADQQEKPEITPSNTLVDRHSSVRSHGFRKYKKRCFWRC